MEKPSGLQPVFPDKIRCMEIASPYGSQTRYDGNRRPEFRFGGYLMIYHEAGSKLKESADTPSRKKTVTIPYMTTDGHIWPPGTRVVWPVACQPR